MKLKILLVTLFSLFTVNFIATPSSVSAHCPLCVAGAAAGVTLTRWVGIDDSITGVWIATLLGSSSFWLYSWLISKKIKQVEKYKKILKPAIYILVFASTIWSFYKFQLVIRMTQIFGLDKLTFGMLAGAILFYLVDIGDNFLIKRAGKVYFPYQRVVFSLGSMVVLSLVIYILINFFI
ncbi:MAG: hypothetical protein ACD_13C00022G0014 [uncultured bacterium]|uniref:Uncharacterized protein n=1 Tax=Candidatus Woesebacteria bacterium GW2011_GWA1_40_43 TaxID=1618553 RepID=A0A0G0UXE0_9BACT|nr:MAG: hypothetical protein ACD_13C00022G0014 [uncultured bacterium]KKR53255.1 MAG: hypothetical protein UT88_C0012G0019 [Candidatus Woesebacteria bacterium GW2011_GWD2_40_19]KKR58094.1 MAG: hypothetical protein UT96_C0010G0020 [Candidatus Woesebacteria bacterium GW2011_GWC2_40_30]KKR64370.1 MAG: hypothetical protein UU02_C0009G0019 [Candidatus Woesebacteria bacterium GW2011_GWA1_40_43]HAU64972.1 hypothetical protein [Candidatus Woesebacteria bacterium]